MKKVRYNAKMIKPMFKTASIAVLFVLFSTLAGCNKTAETPAVIVPPSATTKPPAIRVSPPNVNSGEPAIAGASDGSVFVAWVEHKKGKEANVFVQSFAGDGKPLSEPARVNPQPEQATAWRGDPPTIAVSSDNAVYVGWTARLETPGASANDLYVSVSRDGGRSFNVSAKINDDPMPGPHGMHSLAVDKNGRVFVAWLDERYLKKESAPQEQATNPRSSLPEGFQYEKAQDTGNQKKHQHQHKEPNREVYFSMSSDGGKTFSANKRLAGDVCPCCKTSLHVASDNRVYVGWRQVLKDDYRHIAVTSSTDGGESFAPAVIVSDDRWQIVGCPVSGAALATNSENRLKVAWFTAGDAGVPGIYSAESADGGKTFSPRTLISDVAGAGTPVLLFDAAEGYRAIWSGRDENVLAGTIQSNAANTDVREIEGLYPVAAVAGGQLFTSYIKLEGEKRSIWLSNLSK
ncbi:MAG: glycoside hydrolase [Acidobacteriota bacterium]|nr:glycoside hydrolase [Acidobacteriota bacterium]